MKHRYALIPVLALGCPSLSFAQDAGSLLRDRERGTEIKVPERAPDQQVVPPVVEPEVPREGEKTLLIRAVEFSGKAAAWAGARTV